MTTKIVLDFSVLAFAMEDSLLPLMSTPAYLSLPEANKVEVLTNIVQGQMHYLASLVFMGDYRPSKYTLVFVSDNKHEGKYWRHNYLTDSFTELARVERIQADYHSRVAVHEEAKKAGNGYTGRKPTKPRDIKAICYKGGRKEVSPFQSLLRLVMKEVVAVNGWTYLAVRGYEADDLAATLVVLNDCKHPLWLLTIDTDWLGLIGNGVGWFNTATYSPRVRATLADLNVWAQHRLKTTFEKPSDIWVYKAKVGDASDKLPIFSPIEVIDLLNPPDLHKLWLKPQVIERFGKVLQDNQNDARFSIDAVSFLEDLKRVGIRPFIANV